MKKTVLQSLMVIALLAMISCKQATPSTEAETMESNEESALDYADFDKKVETIRAFFQAHCDENLEAQSAMLADSLVWSPPSYNGNKWLGKEEFLAAIKGYHDGFDNIKYQEGVVTADSIVGGFYSGSHYPKETATKNPNVIRVYGTWTGTHAESGQEVGVKFFNLTTFNEDGKIATMSDYFDLGSLVPKEAED
ncbi:nuclear transport factor 2 family protein [Allomuricauda sp. SCSIO 65647]|uniref:nuclear transport factor 2 family protein n=1 Tax=Allomuricauda sp. SCSIO 65647 TaxID=2908843 RepID=UPI001F1E11EE|nr:nuclear transport factor 2 family protein [Muricauda sp. SCSIO 65647]UJH67769.1 nuclear transport factor 2 family protein [Muricauda sp. SCSIO 65647]